MAKAKKLPSGNWRVQAYATINGSVVKKSFTAGSKKQAELQATQWQLSYNKNISEFTLKEAAEQYIELRTNSLSPTSIMAYKKYLRLYFKGLHNKRIKYIDKFDVENEKNSLMKTLAPKTVKSIVMFYLSVISHYTDNCIKISLPKIEKKLYNTPTADDIQKMIFASKGTDLELPIVLAVWFGLRECEILGLTWDKVKDDYIIIDKALVKVKGGKVLKSTKTNETTRIMQLPPYIKTLIQNTPRKNEFICPIAEDTLRKHYKKVLQDNNLPNYRFHDLRHANASIMLSLDIPNKYAQEHGGWATDETLKKIYQQTYTTKRQAVDKKINDFFENLIKNNHENNHTKPKRLYLKRSISTQ